MSQHTIEIYDAVKAELVPRVGDLGLTAEKIVLGDLSLLPAPEDLFSLVPFILIQPTDCNPQWDAMQRTSETQDTRWTVFYVRKFDVAWPFTSLVADTDRLRTALQGAAVSLRYLKLYLTGLEGDAVRVGEVTQFQVGPSLYRPPESEIIRREPHFWQELTLSAIQFRTEAHVLTQVPQGV